MTTIPAPPGPAGGGYGLRTIKRGTSGMDVAYCQNLLNHRLPTRPLWVDGIFGMKTETAVRQFQQSKQLVADGIVGPMTWGALEAGPPPIKKRPKGGPGGGGGPAGGGGGGGGGVIVPATGGV